MYQIEKSKDGRLHYQGFIVLHNPITLNALKKRFDQKIHLSIRYKDSSADNAANYCMKEESRIDGPWERGDKPSQGKRNDLVRLAQLAAEKKPLATIASTLPVEYLKFHKGVDALRRALCIPRKWPMTVHIRWGPPGGGKSREAWESCPDAYAPVLSKDRIWWDGYCGQKEVILDDFRPSNCSESYLLQLLDRYPMKVEAKGSCVEFCSEVVWITSNMDPHEWYPSKEALFRRFTSCKFVPTTQKSEEVILGSSDNVDWSYCLEELEIT